MGDINTGVKRTLTIVITKKINGSTASGYPKQYNGKNSFIWNSITYPQLTDSDFDHLPYNDYIDRLNSFKGYVENIESGLDINYDVDSTVPYQDDQSCLGICTMYFKLIKQNENAQGSINYNAISSDYIIVTGNSGSNITITGVTTSGSTTIGWARDENGESIIQTNGVLNITIDNGVTIYYIITYSNVKTRLFCYYPPNTKKDDICKSCNKTVTVYYDGAQYSSLGFENVTWYNGQTLTEFVPDGFYKEIGNVIDPPVYVVSNGLVINVDFCDSSILYCSV